MDRRSALKTIGGIGIGAPAVASLATNRVEAARGDDVFVVEDNWDDRHCDRYGRCEDLPASAHIGVERGDRNYDSSNNRYIHSLDVTATFGAVAVDEYDNARGNIAGFGIGISDGGMGTTGMSDDPATIRAGPYEPDEEDNTLSHVITIGGAFGSVVLTGGTSAVAWTAGSAAAGILASEWKPDRKEETYDIGHEWFIDGLSDDPPRNTSASLSHIHVYQNSYAGYFELELTAWVRLYSYGAGDGIYEVSETVEIGQASTT